MARPRRCRCVCNLPYCHCFVPWGEADTGVVNLKIEELEAIRLTDIKKLDQKRAAAAMKVSQPTFSRLLISAHKKIADFLVYTKSLCIEGGDYKVKVPKHF